MNTTTAATQAGVTVATIRTWCRNGVVAAVKAAGRWAIDAASLARRIEIGARRMTQPTQELDENTLRIVRLARLARPHHGPALANRYLLPSMGAVSYGPQEQQGLVESLKVRGRIRYVLSAKGEQVRAQLAA
ncbi:hypothetical protein [Streptomyces sp. enrichment culture]|uniref:hypothetical protein n=1 Tax=Streptomyces sp. enrichment culture TaxID=1795815 RepID=UPI003F558266